MTAGNKTIVPFHSLCQVKSSHMEKSHYLFANIERSMKQVSVGYSTWDGKAADPRNIEVATADWSVIDWRLRMLAGKVLTVIDAALGDKRQNKATKDLIRNAFAGEFGYFSSALQLGSHREFQETIDNMSEEQFNDFLASDCKEVDLKEVIGQ